MKNDQDAAQSTLPVIQADREATIDILLSASLIGKVWAEETRRGEHDDHPLVQAFAHHRIEHSTPDRNAVLEEALLGDEPEIGGRLGWLHALLVDLRDRIEGDSTFRKLWEGDDPAAAWETLQNSEALVEHARVALTTTPEPTEPVGVSEMAEPMPEDPIEAMGWRANRAGVIKGEKLRGRAAENRDAWERGHTARSVWIKAGRPSPTPAVAALRTPDPVLEVAKEALRPMEEWDNRDETVLLLVDYSNGEHPLDDATFALTIGHNNDHNVGEGEGQGWQFAGWCWSHDHYVEGKGKPIGWMPLPHGLAALQTIGAGQ